MEPLGKLEVVLILALDELLDFNVLIVTSLVETTLKQLEVVHIVCLCVGSPLHLREMNNSWVDGVEKLAKERSSTKLLDLSNSNLGKVAYYLKSFVNPLEHVGLGYGVGRVHHSYRVCHSFCLQIIVFNRCSS